MDWLGIRPTTFELADQNEYASYHCRGEKINSNDYKEWLWPPQLFSLAKNKLPLKLNCSPPQHTCLRALNSAHCGTGHGKNAFPEHLHMQLITHTKFPCYPSNTVNVSMNVQKQIRQLPIWRLLYTQLQTFNAGMQSRHTHQTTTTKTSFFQWFYHFLFFIFFLIFYCFSNVSI